MGGHGNLVKQLQELNSKAVAAVNQIVTVVNKPVEKTVAKASRSDTKLSEHPTLKELKKYVRGYVGDKWEELAIQLGLDEEEESEKKLQDIKKERNAMASYEILKLWQSCDQVNLTWGRLIEALDTAGLSDAVKSIKEYFGNSEDAHNQHSPPVPVLQTTKGDRQVNHACANVQQPTAKKYTVQMKTVRDYQHELAAPGINGENYIVVAPTNSLVAALVIADHLERNGQQRKAPKVAVVVKTRPLADQQRDRLAEYIPGEVKRQKELQEARMHTHPAQNVELKCKKCKITACRGSDIYIIDKTGHHVVPGNVLDYELMEHATPGIVDGCGSLMIEKKYKIHCTECNASWGVLGTWPSKKEFPILKCGSFNFFIDRRRVSVPKWKNKPFKASLLSEWLAETN